MTVKQLREHFGIGINKFYDLRFAEVIPPPKSGYGNRKIYSEAEVTRIEEKLRKAKVID